MKNLLNTYGRKLPIVDKIKTNIKSGKVRLLSWAKNFEKTIVRTHYLNDIKSVNLKNRLLLRLAKYVSKTEQLQSETRIYKDKQTKKITVVKRVRRVK